MRTIPIHGDDAIPLSEREHTGSRTAIRALVWMYFWLLILEGPLRKWILPSLSNPLLLVRDPILITIYVVTLSQSLLRMNAVLMSLGLIGMCAALTGMLAGTGNIWVTAYGLDANFLHLPLVFVMPQALRREDVTKIGRWVLILSIPMALLMVLQFRSDSYAFVNFGPGASPGTQMQAVLGKIRPPGFFNFITGAAQFLSLATAFIVYGLLSKDRYNGVFLLICCLAVVISAVVSTSRLTLGGISLVFLMIGVIGIYNRSIVRGVVGMLLPLGLVFLVATNLDIFHEGKYVLEARLEDAGDAGAGLTQTASNWSERVLGDFLAGFKAMAVTPPLGLGLGYGTNVGSRILTGRVGFLADEREWGRIIMEMGPFLGASYLLVRISLFVALFIASARSARRGNFLPMLLLGSCGLNILNGQFSVASTLGFTVFCAGLCLAAANSEEGASDDAKRSDGQSVSSARSRKRIGMSRYAQVLHGVRNDRKM